MKFSCEKTEHMIFGGRCPEKDGKITLPVADAAIEWNCLPASCRHDGLIIGFSTNGTISGPHVILYLQCMLKEVPYEI